jgi:uncharacterized membrane protein
MGVVVQSVQSISGPLPSPEIIAEYDRILPGAADRIIRMAENEQTHTHEMHIRSGTHRFVITVLGQVFGFCIGISGVCGGVYLVAHDKSLAGFGVFFASLGAIVGAFLYGKKRAPAQTQTLQTRHE